MSEKDQVTEHLRYAELCSHTYLDGTEQRRGQFELSGLEVFEDHIQDSNALAATAFPVSYMIGLIKAPSRKMKSQVVVVYRGTKLPTDILLDLQMIPILPSEHRHKQLKVQSGPWAAISNAISEIKKSINEACHLLLKSGSSGSGSGIDLVFTGHSLGGSYAALTRLNILLHQGLEVRCNIKVVTFGSPLVYSVSDGDPDVIIPSDLHKLYAYVNAEDLIPRLLGMKCESWDSFLHTAEKDLSSRATSTGLLVAGTMVCGAAALTLATGGIATAALIVTGGALSRKVKSNTEEFSKLAGKEHSTTDICHRSAGAIALLKVLQSLRSRKYLDSSEAKSYVPVGQFRFLSSDEGLYACKEGRDALDQLQIPSKLCDSIGDHSMQNYVQALRLLLQL
jgi:hypothetical protein